MVRRKEVNPAFLEARLIGTTFRFQFGGEEGGREEEEENDTMGDEVKKVQIPKTFDIYAVKGIAGRLFGHEPLRLKLVWETGEWDPVAGFDEDAGDSSEDEAMMGDEEEEKEQEVVRVQQEEEDKSQGKGNSSNTNRAGRWIKREVELTDSPRQFGFCVDGMDVTIRVEPR